MAPSAQFTSHRPNTLPNRVNIHAQASSPLQQEIPRNSILIVRIRTKDYMLWFDGKEVEIFIKRVENIAEIEGESGRDIKKQISVWTNNQETSYHIEGMPRYETGDWEELKLDMKRRWGTISPEKRYKLSSITQTFTSIQEEGGIQKIIQYKMLIGEYESIINYLKRHQHIQGDINHNRKVWYSISSSAQASIYKEIIKDKAILKALDGGHIIPRLGILKLYIEPDLEAKVLIQQKEFSQAKSK
ncbi:hypothetical protein O181_041955 [Austropuccinia psidii MF-1]|uniref:Uncharacterized protein n=1 Tax=Austropuccinia psidii MF-1 TaxID=1389203 RepID=A0A9Q3HHN4_9BASI|nr:hypothetical protein [Austropuccinia psidii MF-1]